MSYSYLFKYIIIGDTGFILELTKKIKDNKKNKNYFFINVSIGVGKSCLLL